MKRQIVLLFAVLLCTAACSVMNKKPVVKDTRWKSVYEMFVSDAGTETVTVTLEFVSAKEYVLETKSVMPSYPAMYMNSDGTIDTMPGWSREYTTRGTYSVGRGEVVLTEKEGAVHTLHYTAGNLVSSDLSFQPLVFTREE